MIKSKQNNYSPAPEENVYKTQEICPVCKKAGEFIPPPITDKKKRKLIVAYECPSGHKFTKEFDLK